MVLQAISSAAAANFACLLVDPTGASCGFPPSGIVSEPISTADAIADALHAEILTYDIDNPPVPYGPNFNGWNAALISAFCPGGQAPDYRTVAKYPDFDAFGRYTGAYHWHSITPGDSLPGGSPFPQPDSGAPTPGVNYGIGSYTFNPGVGIYYYWIVSVMRLKIFGYPQICESVKYFDGHTSSVQSCGLVAIPSSVKDYTYFSHPAGVANTGSALTPYRVHQPWIVDARFAFPGSPCPPHFCSDCACTA